MISVFIKTVQQILTSPVLFFRSHQVGDKWGPPLMFGLICQFIAYASLMLYQVFWSFLPTAFLAGLGHLKAEDLAQFVVTPFFFGFLLLAAPVLGFMVIVFSTALNHFILWLLKGANAGLKGTFDAICYAQAAQVVMLVPILGSLIAGIWQIVLVIIGLREIHRISTGKAVLTVLLPMIVCCGLALFLGAFIFVSVLVPLFMKSQ
ncbi:MAG: YIP1 family protein [Deltaproteobacteria bacterium]|nr:YIP1 family protein [Deltaproteobacteria bacterium]